MGQPYLPFVKPSISKEAIAEVVACLESGWLATGPRVQRFEAELTRYVQAPHVLALTSATAGLQLALQALELKAGDEVITTPLTFVASLNTIVQAGAKPVLVDIDPHTYNLDIEKVAAAITSRTKAIMPVHFAGLPVDLDALYALAMEHELRIIEDAAHAIGTQYKGRLIGSFGDTQVFSFHPNKNMTTGEGGCVATRDDELAKKITTLRFHGIDRAAFNRFSKEGSQEYDVIVPGYKYNMMDIQAALGLHQLPALEGFIERRTALANRYQMLLADCAALQLPSTPNYAHRHAWHLYTPLIKAEVVGVDRTEFMQKMKQQNIGTGLHFQAAHLFHYYQQQFGYKLGDFPHAEYVGERIVSLPLFPDMTEAEQDRVIDAIKKIL